MVAPSALPHAEVTHALLDGVREDAEHADHRQQERQPGERHHQHRPKPMACGRFPRDVLERHHVPDAHQLLLVDATDRRTDGRRKRFGAS